MRKDLQFLLCFIAISCMAVTCKKQSAALPVVPDNNNLVNLSHLDYLYTPLTFLTGTKAAGIFIYAEAPDYRLVTDADEGFTCVDDVARAVQVYVRSPRFDSDTSVRNKVFNLIRFVLEMQSDNGYFYNFIFPDLSINKNGITSRNEPNWWSWRALYTLTETSPLIRIKDAQLADEMEAAISKLITKIKTDLAPIPKTTKIVTGITVPEWLPAGSGTDQAAILILGLIPKASNDPVLTAYIKKLADGIVLMQQGDATHFPYSCILSWENTWHAYASEQAFALMKAGAFLNTPTYSEKGMAEVDNFYPWLLKNGMKSSFVFEKNGNEIRLTSEKTYEQIAYGIRPMFSAAVEAYRLTKNEKYADIAGQLAAWFLGANAANKIMYNVATGRCFDGIESSNNVNINSGAESTIEALFTMQIAENYPSVITALNKYKR